MKPTHFLCIPLVTRLSRPGLSAELSALKSYITSADNISIPASAVRPLSTIHLTLGVMSLPEPKNVEEATQVLQSIIPLLPQRPIKISLLGLGTFPGIDPGRAEILFAHPTCLDYDFDALCQRIRHVFEDAGIFDKRGFSLFLHATILNARKTADGGLIDATEILRNYRGHVWMENVPLEEIGICRMGAKKKGGDDEEYLLAASIPLTTSADR
ncbi:hypothetical protein CFRS1_v015957 [Colletotrichum fructicola]|nr:hypothetical protein CFRS1_v015957 [Colletotrichum fructicola]